MRADRLIGGFLAAALLALPGIVTGPALAEDELPDCNGPEMHLDEQGLHAPCRILASHGGAAWTYAFSFRKGETYEHVTVRVAGPDGPVDTFEGTIDGAYAYPAVRDLNGDGVPEVIIPEISGNANTSAVLYLWDAAAGGYSEAGPILYSAEPVDGGLIRSWARGNCCSGDETYQSIRDGRLVTEFIVQFEAALNGETDPADLCHIVDEGGLALHGLDSAAGRAALCARNPYLEN